MALSSGLTDACRLFPKSYWDSVQDLPQTCRASPSQPNPLFPSFSRRLPPSLPTVVSTLILDRYCIDECSSAATVKALKRPTSEEFGDFGISCNIACVRHTANRRAGRIGKFTLTLDKAILRKSSRCAPTGSRKRDRRPSLSKERISPRPRILRPGSSDRVSSDRAAFARVRFASRPGRNGPTPNPFRKAM